MPRKSGVCIVTTTKNAGPALDTFIEYHLRVGIRKIYLFFDDASDPNFDRTKRYAEVRGICVGRKLMQLWKQTRTYRGGLTDLKQTFTRQSLNTEIAIGWAMADNLAWILHLDDDELFYSKKSILEHFDEQPPSVGQITYVNFEGAPETFQIRNIFKDVSLFKRNCFFDGHYRLNVLGPKRKQLERQLRRPTFYLGYGSGKSAARLVPGLLPFSGHEFVDVKRYKNRFFSFADPCILHFNMCGYANYLNKVENWAYNLYQQPNETILSRSRAAYLAGDTARLRAIYRNEIMYSPKSGEVTGLRDAKLLFRLPKLRQLLP